MKVHQHNLAINAFMKIFGLEPEQPRIYLEKPSLDYLVVAINNQIPVAVADDRRCMSIRATTLSGPC